MPEAADILLLIEVADSSLALDRDVKLARCAACGIAEAWLVDAHAGTILRCRGPGPDGYRSIDPLQGERTVPIPGLPDCLLDLHDLG